MRALTRSAVLGQLGIAAAFEMHKAVVMSGLRAALTQMPTFRATINAVRKGHQFTDDLGRDIRTLWGFGTESAAGMRGSMRYRTLPMIVGYSASRTSAIRRRT